MQIFVGTSGFGYKEWKGRFYPDDLGGDEFLSYYATHFQIVEINNTFYRMPSAEQLDKWAAQVPEHFTFVFKASRRITHSGRLRNTDDSVSYLWSKLEPLGSKLGPVLFQLPPQFRADHEVLRNFLQSLPQGMRAAFEFRHGSWITPQTIECLAQAGAVLVTAEGERPGPTPPIYPGATWGYLRLHKFDYSDAELQAWARRLREQAWERAYVFFKHEDEARGPRFAKRFLEVLD